MLSKNFYSISFIIICFLLAGCAAEKLYSGPKLPESEVAILQSGFYMEITGGGLDEEGVTGGKKALIPDTYSIYSEQAGVKVKMPYQTRTIGNLTLKKQETTVPHCTATVYLEKGKSYRIFKNYKVLGHAAGEKGAVYIDPEGRTTLRPTGFGTIEVYRETSLFSYKFVLVIKEVGSGKTVGSCIDTAY